MALALAALLTEEETAGGGGGGGAAAAAALASLDVRGNALDAAALRALAALVAAAAAGAGGLEALSLSLPPLSSAIDDREREEELKAALEALLDAAAASASLQRLELEGPQGYLTDGVVAAIVRAERAFARNRIEAAEAAAAGVGVGVGEGEKEEEQGPSLSALVCSILFNPDRGWEEDGAGRGEGQEEDEDVATTVEVLTQRLRGVQVRWTWMAPVYTIGSATVSLTNMV